MGAGATGGGAEGAGEEGGGGGGVDMACAGGGGAPATVNWLSTRVTPLVPLAISTTLSATSELGASPVRVATPLATLTFTFADLAAGSA